MVEEELPMDIGLDVAQLVMEGNGKRVMEIVEANNMVEFYKKICSEFPKTYKLDAAKVAKMTSDNEAKLKELEAEVTDKEENYGEVEVVEALLNKATFHYLTGTKEKALEAYNTVSEGKTMSTGQLIDITLKKILLGFFWMDFDLIKENLYEADKLMEQGGDWERRNRLKVYRGLFATMSRDFKTASENFLAGIATFTCTELCSYNTFIFYTIVTSITTLERVEFKKKVIDAPEVRAALYQAEELPDFLNALQDTEYRAFFASLTKMYPRIKKNRYLTEHTDWFIRELRVKAYTQFLESYKSVTIQKMSEAFGVSVNFLDNELSHFIASQRIAAKIDKAGGVIEAGGFKDTSYNSNYQEVMKQGDLLLNRVQLLSRLLNV